jgi:hypothetical protein
MGNLEGFKIFGKGHVSLVFSAAALGVVVRARVLYCQMRCSARLV